MAIAGRPIGTQIAERWLTDTCTLESPDRTQSTGFKTEGTAIPCRLVDDHGGPIVTAGAAPTVQQPRVYFKKSQALSMDWRITVTSQANRQLKVDLIVVPPEAPVQYVTASGIRR